ncbi:ubiquitin carboxyl-terminal hydrolase isozyme L3 isoform X2 [Cephus cinctus]|uniref:ubiquitinyl hydrolase 1 n=1 Tax=Cephus cinctus TaxID=211228 RepID=A0AAJ7C6N0_CEPCN|nr:ubiquitin carboxyl-terminal hydrolase isozyme L3 isoform X2 [Cephus cinctus]
MAWVPLESNPDVMTKTSSYYADQESKMKEGEQPISEKIYHMKQCVSNACGTVALIHSVANNTDQIILEDGILKSFLDETKDLPFAERGEMLMQASGVIDTHKESAQEGQTEAPGDDTPVIHHFIAFVEKDGSLYELDGRKPFPVNHGPSTPETFLEDAARVCRDYMSRDPDEMRFTMVALAATD